MRLYYNKSTGQCTRLEIFYTVLFTLLLIIGLSLCPNESIYNVNEDNVLYYSISLFLTSLSIIYFFVKCAVKYKEKWESIKVVTMLLLIACGILSVLFIFTGNVKSLAGSSVLFGVLLGSVLAIII